MPGVRRSGAPLAALLRCVLAALLLALGGAAAAQTDDLDAPLARRVKAAFIYQFLGYIEWPSHAFADSASPLVIGVLGNERVVDEMKEVIGERMAQGRSVVVRRLRDGDALTGTHVVYVTRAESARVPALATASRGSGTLLVTEADNALGLGSAINFRLVEGRVRFDIGLAAAERAGLRISSRLLAVAQSVRST